MAIRTADKSEVRIISTSGGTDTQLRAPSLPLRDIGLTVNVIIQDLLLR